MWNGCFQYSELQRRLNIILSILSEGSGRTHLGQRCSPRLRLCIRLCLFGCFLTRFPFFLFLHTFYVTSSHVFRRSWWHIFESFPFGGDFSFEGVHGLCCVPKIDYLSRVVPSLFAPFVSELSFNAITMSDADAAQRCALRQEVTIYEKCLIHGFVQQIRSSDRWV
jgi:hypothetical protein